MPAVPLSRSFGASADGRLQTLPSLEPLSDELRSEMKDSLKEQSDKLSAAVQASSGSLHGGSIMADLSMEEKHVAISPREDSTTSAEEKAVAISIREDSTTTVGTNSSAYGFKEDGAWTFHSQNVADNFDNEMHGHIAGYGAVIRLCAELSLRIHGPEKRILSYWCGIGNQFEQVQLGFEPQTYVPTPPLADGVALPTHVWQYLCRGWDPKLLEGMNYSEPLRKRCQERFPEINCHKGDDTKGAWDPTSAGGPEYFATIQMLWALHFEGTAEKRLALLHKAFEALLPGGLMMLADKTRQPDVLEGLYHDYKRQQLVKEEVVQAKKKAIVGVLVPFETQWYEEALRECGFVDIAIVHGVCGFVTWMARKPNVAGSPGAVVDGGTSLHGHRPSNHSSDVRHLFQRPEQSKLNLDGQAEKLKAPCTPVGNC